MFSPRFLIRRYEQKHKLSACRLAWDFGVYSVGKQAAGLQVLTLLISGADILLERIRSLSLYFFLISSQDMFNGSNCSKFGHFPNS